MSTRSTAIPQIAGYEMVSRLGRGAHSTISLAVETAARRQVAIKHVIRRTAADDRFIEQAEIEYEVGCTVDHPSLRKCYEIIRNKKWLKTTELYLIMEYVEGDTLEHHSPERLDSIVDVFLKVAAALQAMHAAGFVHADMKKNNVLLTPSGGVKLIDFGQSCRIGQIKERIQGTPDYIAPEQVKRGRIDQRTDVFNFGATMYWVITDRAFTTLISTAQTGEKKIAIDSRRSNRPPSELNPLVPLALSNLVMECCDNDPEARPREMRDVISRLEIVQHLLTKRERETPVRHKSASRKSSTR